MPLLIWIIVPEVTNEREEQFEFLIPSQKALNTIFDSCLVFPVPGNYYQ